MYSFFLFAIVLVCFAMACEDCAKDLPSNKVHAGLDEMIPAIYVEDQGIVKKIKKKGKKAFEKGMASDEFRFQQAKNPHSELVPIEDSVPPPMNVFPTSVEVPYVPVNLAPAE